MSVQVTHQAVSRDTFRSLESLWLVKLSLHLGHLQACGRRKPYLQTAALDSVLMWGLSPLLSFWLVLTLLGYGLPSEKQGVKRRPDVDEF